MNCLFNRGPDSDFGLVIDWDFHLNNRWVCAMTPYLVNEIVKVFNPVILSSQSDYELKKKKIKYIISMEPGWAAPKITYDKFQKHVIGIFVSDPHNKTSWFQDYFLDNNINFAFSFYKNPFFYHFSNFPREKLIHFPWAVPDQLISTHEIKTRTNDVIIFGGKNSDAYDVRNWCREQIGVTNYDNSGVENKKLSDEEYFIWLTNFDAIVAAGSSNPIYELVTPKYFEIAAAGALLIGQYCKDLEDLGFNETNSIIFTKETFIEKIWSFKKNPDSFLKIRNAGRDLIKTQHKLSDRIKLIKQVLGGNK